MSAFERPTDDREDGALAAYELSNRDCDEGGTCPLNSGKVQLLPLRYGLVEELEPGCATPYTLSARPLGIRLLRNGYLYVLDAETHELDEYAFSDQGDKITGGKLEYDTDRTLYVCFSEVKWTDAKRAQVLESEDDRDAFMQAVDLSGANPINGGGEHLITTAQAEAWVAEFAEEAELEQPEDGHAQEGEAYHWENDHYYHKTRLGKLLKQHDVGDRDECLCLVVRDDIGVMRDLAMYQDNVVGWIEEWTEEQEKRTQRNYVLGCYIESITQLTAETLESLAPGEEGSPELALWQDLEALEEPNRERTRQTLLDYLNTEHTLPRSYDPDLPDELRERLLEVSPDPSRTNAYKIQQNQQREIRRYYANDALADADSELVERHLDTLIDLKETNNRRVRDILEGASFGQRGVNDLIRRGEMDRFLEQQRPKLARWNALLTHISQDRVEMLCSNAFHLAAWYFDADSEDQVEKAFSAEYACTRDICRDDDVIERIKQWLTEHPEYDRPLFHTRSLEEQAALIKDYTAIISAGYGILNHLDSWVDRLKEAENGKLPDLTTLPKEIQPLANGARTNLTPAVGAGLARIMEQLQQSMGQGDFVMPDLEDLFRQLDPPAAWARIVDAAKENGARFVFSTQSLEELMDLVEETLALRQRLTSLNNRRRQARGAERDRLSAERRGVQAQLDANEQRLAAALSPVGDVGADDPTLSEGDSGRAGLVLEFDDAGKAVAVGRLTSNLRQGIYRAPPAGLLGDGVGLLVFIGQAVGLWAAARALRYAEDDATNEELKDLEKRFWAATFATGAAGFLAAQSIGDTALQAQARALGNAVNASRASGVYAQLGRMHFGLGVAGYFTGLGASVFGLYSNRGNWQDAVRRGNSAAQGAAALSMMGDAGLMGAHGYGLVSNARAGIAVARGATTWAMAGPHLASVFWRFNAIGLAFSLLQLGGTWLYNRHNISQHDQWLLASPWGTEEGNESLEHYLSELRRISQAAHITLEEVYAESWRPNWTCSPDHYQVALHLPGLSPEALQPPLVGQAPVRLSLKAWQVQPVQIWQRDGTVRAPEHWLEATNELAEALALGTDGDKGHVLLSGLAPDHRQTPHGYDTEHWVVGVRLEHLNDEGNYQASDVYIYIDPRGGAGSGKRYTPSDFPRRGDPGSWYAVDL
nr:toxin VasX [Halomonas socia]